MTFVRDHAGGSDKTADTTLDVALSASVAAANTLFLALAFDNGAAGFPNVSSITVPGGESASWVKLGAFTTSGAGASAVVGELWAITTTVLWSSSFVATITIDTSRTAKAGALQEHTGVTVTQRGSAATNTSTTSAPSATNANPVVGDLVIGASGWETGTVPTGDADTTNGSWSSVLAVASVGGLDGSNVTAALQYKYVTATGSQTYNPTDATSNDSGVILSAVQPASAAAAGTGSMSFGGSGSAGAPVAGSGSLALSGSGGAATPTTAAGSLSLSGAATAATAVGGGTGALALSGSGAVTPPAAGGTGSLSLDGTGTAGGDSAATGTGALALSGSGAVTPPAAGGTGSLGLSGSGSATSPTGGSGSIALSGAAAVAAPAGGTGSIALSGAGTAASPAGGTGSLVLVGAGALAAQAAAQALLTLSGLGAAEGGAIAAAGTGHLELAGVGHAFMPRDLNISASISPPRFTASITPPRFTAAIAPPDFTARIEEP